ncbi:hypothetical protein CgunFtcFv8_004264 [Champsocephalus gunnari]|uniref:Uncharacterized protein n=1 Tax=Champsocephalus gunnari TaxID=52237 RepID=A0AAN8HY19_CHAGU|nr:hypothetical protein CgunFtcFv8_004264 [Champsocephalus gunnari]
MTSGTATSVSLAPSTGLWEPAAAAAAATSPSDAGIRAARAAIHAAASRSGTRQRNTARCFGTDFPLLLLSVNT